MRKSGSHGWRNKNKDQEGEVCVHKMYNIILAIHKSAGLSSLSSRSIRARAQIYVHMWTCHIGRAG